MLRPLRQLLMCAFIVSAPAIAVETVTIRYDNPIFAPVGYEAVNITVGGQTLNNEPVGRFQATVLGYTSGLTSSDFVDNTNDLFTYCYDLFEYIYQGQTVTYTVNFTGPTARTLDYLGAVNYVLNGNTNTWSDPYAWLHPANAVVAVAVQAGIWESLYDTSGWDLASGNLRVTGLDAATSGEWALFQAAVQNPGVNDLPASMAMTITGPGVQDQIIGRNRPSRQQLPEPGSLVLVGVALAMAGLAMRRRARV